MPRFGSSASMKSKATPAKAHGFSPDSPKTAPAKSEQPATQWNFTTAPDGNVTIKTQAASTTDIFRQWIEDGITSAEDIAREMNVSKGTISKMAKKGIEAGWLTKNGRGYALAK